MSLFESLKNIPKVDMHINLTSSISTDLAFDLSDEMSILDIEEEMREKNVLEYMDALKLPVKILRKPQNVILAINDLIDRLESNNVIYSELFLDLPLYNKRIDEEKILLLILDVIKKRQYNMNIVMVLSSEKAKDDNLKTLGIFEKYYQKGVNGLYFHKNKMANLSDYAYLFDRLSKNNYPYILNMNSKIVNTDYEIYMNAKRIIYALPTIDDSLILETRKNDIMLEFSITRFIENNIISNLKDHFLFDLIKTNTLLTLTSYDMTTLNTDILNEWCLVFNSFPLTLLDMVRVINNDLVKANIAINDKEPIINRFKEESNSILDEE